MESVSEQDFRDTMARWPTGVTVFTARHDDEPLGMTVSSLASLSLEPPLVLACIATTAFSHDGLTAAPGFAVHVLGAEQEDMSTLFSRPGSDKFGAFPDERGPFDAPLLPFGVARLVCERHATLDGGDHTILVGRVVSTELAGTDPLVYCNRAYERLRWGTAAST